MKFTVEQEIYYLLQFVSILVRLKDLREIWT